MFIMDVEMLKFDENIHCFTSDNVGLYVRSYISWINILELHSSTKFHKS